MLYPNQRGITIHKELIQQGSKEPFLAVKNVSLFYAMKDLTNSAFKVYIYFLANRDKYRMGISPAAIKNQTGVCIETARKAIRELEIKGYIVYAGDMKYHFFEIPHKDENFGFECYREEFHKVFDQSQHKNDFKEIDFNDNEPEWLY